MSRLNIARGQEEQNYINLLVQAIRSDDIEGLLLFLDQNGMPRYDENGRWLSDESGRPRLGREVPIGLLNRYRDELFSSLSKNSDAQILTEILNEALERDRQSMIKYGNDDLWNVGGRKSDAKEKEEKYDDEGSREEKRSNMSFAEKIGEGIRFDPEINIKNINIIAAVESLTRSVENREKNLDPENIGEVFLELSGTEESLIMYRFLEELEKYDRGLIVYLFERYGNKAIDNAEKSGDARMFGILSLTNEELLGSPDKKHFSDGQKANRQNIIEGTRERENQLVSHIRAMLAELDSMLENPSVIGAKHLSSLLAELNELEVDWSGLDERDLIEETRIMQILQILVFGDQLQKFQISLGALNEHDKEQLLYDKGEELVGLAESCGFGEISDFIRKEMRNFKIEPENEPGGFVREAGPGIGAFASKPDEEFVWNGMDQAIFPFDSESSSENSEILSKHDSEISDGNLELIDNREMLQKQEETSNFKKNLLEELVAKREKQVTGETDLSEGKKIISEKSENVQQKGEQEERLESVDESDSLGNSQAKKPDPYKLWTESVRTQDEKAGALKTFQR